METIELGERAFEDLRTAFQHNSFETECYLDTEEGRVIWFSSDMPPVNGEPDGEDPEWVHEAYQKRMQVWNDDNGRFLEVPPGSIADRMADMELFLDEQADNGLCERFRSGGKSSTRLDAFRRAIERDGRQRQKWRKFCKERACDRIEEWLQLQGYRLQLADRQKQSAPS